MHQSVIMAPLVVEEKQGVVVHQSLIRTPLVVEEKQEAAVNQSVIMTSLVMEEKQWAAVHQSVIMTPLVVKNKLGGVALVINNDTIGREKETDNSNYSQQQFKLLSEEMKELKKIYMNSNVL